MGPVSDIECAHSTKLCERTESKLSDSNIYRKISVAIAAFLSKLILWRILTMLVKVRID